MESKSRHYHRSFVKDNTIVIIGHLLIYMKGIILMPIIIKSAGVTVYGGYVLLMSILGIIIGVSSFGVGFKARRFLPSTIKMKDRGELFYRQFFFQLFAITFLSLLLVLLNKQINKYFFKDEVSYSVLIIPIYLVCYFLYSQATDYFRYTSRVNYMTIAALLFPYLSIGLVLSFLLFYKYLNVNFLILSDTSAAVLVVIPCFWIIFREIGIRLSTYDLKGVISDIRLGFPLVLSFIIDFILAAGDRYFIAFYLSVSAVGYYNPGYALGSLIIVLPKAMSTVLPQLMSKASDQNDEHEAQRMLNYSIKIFLLCAIPFIFGSMIISKILLTLFANGEVAEKSYLVIPVVALGALFYGLNIILSNVLFVQMKTNEMFKMNLLATMFNLLANLILFYFFKNIIVAAITTLLSYFIAFIYINKIIVKSWSVDYSIAAIAKSVLASSFMTAVLSLVSSRLGRMNNISVLIVDVVSGAIVYFAIIFSVGVFTKKEIQFVKDFLIVRKSK